MRYLFGFVCVCALGVVPLVGCSETQAECESAEDCSDGNQCTEDACDSASRTCSNTPVDDGTDCTFNSIAGVCVSGVCGQNLCQGVVCEDDGNECTGDVCNFADGTCNVSDGTSCSTGACLDGVCAALATVSGTVTLFENYYGPGTPAAGATVSVHGTSLSTTTDEDGGFSFDVFIGDWFFRASKEDTWGFIELGTVSTTGPNGIGLEVDADAFVAQFEQELKEQGLKIDIDDTKGVIAMDFDRVSYLGGETATLSESYDFAIAFDADGNPVSSEKLLSDGDRVLSFFNVDLTEELTVTPMGVEGVNTCSLDRPGTVYPVLAKSVTFMPVGCTPVP
ncbi:MAG: hypothetical protein JRE45_15725 [Deltaproteobacteria bacterium]|nr:hypothetical protein [Deltaproteobacteria bacterium]